MKAMLALEHNFLPASLHFQTPNEAVDFNALNVHVAAEPIELLHGKQARLAGVNSFGFGGTNAHVIISDPQAEPEKVKPEASGKVFFASAHTASALEALLESYRASLKVAGPAERRSIIAAAGAGRPFLKHRFVAVGDDPERHRQGNRSARPAIGASRKRFKPRPSTTRQGSHSSSRAMARNGRAWRSTRTGATQRSATALT